MEVYTITPSEYPSESEWFENMGRLELDITPQTSRVRFARIKTHLSIDGLLRRRPEHNDLGEILSVELFTCDLVDDEELPLAWLTDLAVDLIFSKTRPDPLLLTLRATLFVLAVSGHVSPSDMCKASLMQNALS